MSEPRRDVLIWVSPEFLKSPGMIQLLTEAGILSPPEDDIDEYIGSAEAAGGFAITGKLADPNHGAGIWVSPAQVPGLEMMIPWHFVRSVVTAQSSPSSQAFGLMSDLAHPAPPGKKVHERGPR